MSLKPKLEVRLYDGDGKYDYALFRSDQSTPICSGLSHAHALHVKGIVGRMENVPESFPPIKEWYKYDKIIEVE